MAKFARLSGASKNYARGAYSNVPTGVCLLYMGGPSSLEEVQPFLDHLFSDRELIQLPGGRWLQKPLAKLISKFRASKVQQYYAEIGGGSPLGKITAEQAQLLQNTLQSEGAYHVEVAMRYCAPRVGEAIQKLAKQGIKRCVVLPLYPQFSRATTGSSLRDFDQTLTLLGMDWEVITINEFHIHSLYLEALAAKVQEGLQGLPDNTTVIFSAHSLPQKFIEAGDPYQDQVCATVAGVVERLKLKHWALGFQSRSGPVRWLEPEIVDLVDKIIAQGAESLLIVPVSFVSDHIETLHEIDIRLRRHCEMRGLKHFTRAPSLNDDPRFIGALAQLVKEACLTK